MRPLSVLMIAQYVCVTSTTLSGAVHCLALPPAGGFVVGSATPRHGDCPLSAAAEMLALAVPAAGAVVDTALVAAPEVAGAGLGVMTTTLALHAANSTELTA